MWVGWLLALFFLLLALFIHGSFEGVSRDNRQLQYDVERGREWMEAAEKARQELKELRLENEVNREAIDGLIHALHKADGALEKTRYLKVSQEFHGRSDPPAADKHRGKPGLESEYT